MTEAIQRVLGDRWTYLRIVYLLLAFPLGTTYFVLLITGLSVGVGLSIIGVGLVILALTVVGWLFVARFERELAIHLLGASVRPFSLPGEALRPWPRLLKTLGEPTTWKALAYLLLEFPFGIITFTLTIVLLSISLAFIAAPFAYLAQVLFGPSQIQVGPGFTLFPNNPPFGGEFLLAVAIGALGVVLGVGSMALLSGIGWAWGRFAEQMLGVDPSRLQLAAAEAEAASQRRRAERADHSRREPLTPAVGCPCYTGAGRPSIARSARSISSSSRATSSSFPAK